MSRRGSNTSAQHLSPSRKQDEQSAEESKRKVQDELDSNPLYKLDVSKWKNIPQCISETVKVIIQTIKLTNESQLGIFIAESEFKDKVNEQLTEMKIDSRKKHESVLS